MTMMSENFLIEGLKADWMRKILTEGGNVTFQNNI